MHPEPNFYLIFTGRLNAQGIHYMVTGAVAALAYYVILRKLEYFREGRSEKHLIDIRGMIELSSQLIDFGFLERKIAAYGLQAEWEEVRNR
ncbi:MAG: hypothetical protein AB1512_09630 [Thermodesulfobacteriota bacterium]